MPASLDDAILSLSTSWHLPLGTLRASLEDRVCDFRGNRDIPGPENDKCGGNLDHLLILTLGIHSTEPDTMGRRGCSGFLGSCVSGQKL